MQFGEMIIGPPGSGKTTYIQKCKTKLTRKHILINLDPGNIQTERYDYDIREVYSTTDFMLKEDLGPNGALVKIIEIFSYEADSFITPILHENEDSYFVFDFPGQVEFFVANNSLKRILSFLRSKRLNIVVVNLFDLVNFVDNRNIIYTFLISTLSMIILESPQICVISKCGMIMQHDKVDLIQILERPVLCDYKDEFHNTLLRFIDDYSFVDFQLLDIDNEDTVNFLQYIVDLASGYFYENEDDLIYTKLISRDDIIGKYLT